MRAFVAVPLPEAARTALVDLQADLDQGRLVPEANLHLTLAFLDDQPEAELERLHDVLSDISMDEFDLSFSGVEAPGGRKPALIWAGVEASEGLTRLHQRVRAAAQQIGMELPRRRFRPHVTVARIGRHAPLDPERLGIWLARHGAMRAGPFPIRCFCLYRSQLGPGGAVYDMLAEYPFEGGSVPRE